MKNCVKCGPLSDDLLVFDVQGKVKICENCILTMNSYVEKKYAIEPEAVKEFKVPSIESLISHLNKHVIGQTEAKETLAVAVRNHYKRMSLSDEERSSIDKSNVLIMGPSGSGKTHMVKTLTKFIDVPHIIVDATVYTSAGYVGSEVKSIIEDLYYASGKDKELTERGIVFIDEIDKKKKTGSNTGVEPGGEQALQALLKLVEGTKIKITKTVEIDTTNILFIAGGAFVGIDKIAKQRIKTKSGFGFNSAPVDDVDQLLQEVSTEDIIEFGIIPEFIGRFPVITYTKDLTKEHIISVIKDTENSILCQFKRLFLIEDDIKLSITNDAISLISDIVLRDKIGVRGIRKVFEKVLHPIQCNMEQIKLDGGNAIKITSDSIKNSKPPMVVYSNGKCRQLPKRRNKKAAL